jgi:hypothetical protein
MHGVYETLDLILFIACGLLISVYVAAYLLCPSTVCTVFVAVTDSNAVV